MKQSTTRCITKNHSSSDRENIKRKMKLNDIYFAYSYERVTPGENYYNSISNYYRVFAGINDYSAKKCKQFLEKIINTKIP